jgi:hypothetical protein
MNFRRIAALAALPLLALALFGVPHRVIADATDMNYVLFPGATTDTTEQASYWIPVQGARRIYIRTFSTATTSDTSTCDSITTWKTLFSDTLSFVGRDSVGTIVSGTAPRGTTTQYPTVAIMADSIATTGQAMDSLSLIGVYQPAITRPLRGSGAMTCVYPATYLQQSNGVGTLINEPVMDQNGVIERKYMRIRVTPRTRLTTAGFSSTQGIRTSGIRGLKMTVRVEFPIDKHLTQ